MKNKNLRILFLYPNLNMSTLVPNAISILTAVLKQANFNNIDLFDTTFYKSEELSKFNKVQATKKIYKILNDEIKKYIHSIQILIN